MTDKQKLLPVIQTSKGITQDDGFYKYLREVNQIPSLTKEEEFLLAKAYLEKNDIDAAHTLVRSHLKLVAKMAIGYKNYGLPVNDLISEGNLGLMQAVKKYNPNLGFRLSTYAMWWIKASIQEHILSSWSLVKIGTTAAQKKLFFSLNKVKRKIANLYSRQVQEDDYDHIAHELGVSTTEVREMDSRLSHHDKSLNQTIGNDDEGGELIELLPEQRPGHDLIIAEAQELSLKKEILFKAISTLNPREQEIVKSRKLADKATTLDDLSKKYSISKERVRQIENRALEKMQQIMLEEYQQISSQLKK